MPGCYDYYVRCHPAMISSAQHDESRVCEQVVPDTIWTFEQEQTFALTNVSTVVRMTVVKLKSGGLFVYAPIAPTT